jgi:metal-responsive CopG/Arc/MetJ family transcriptional regulator
MYGHERRAMSEEMMRTHVVIPKVLVETIDALVGKRRRSEFLSVAAEKEVRRLKLIKAAEKAGGSLEHVDISGWETSESAAEWVRASRRSDEERLSRLFKEP